MDGELLQLKAQVNALSRAWLYLAAAVEIQGGLDPATFDEGLRQRGWPGTDAAFEAEARQTVDWLLDQLADARARRSGGLPG